MLKATCQPISSTDFLLECVHVFQLKVLASRKWGATSAGDALPLSAMASNLTTGHGRSSEAPRYPRELLLELAHAQSGVWDQEQVRSDTEFLFLPKSEHFSQKQPTMFQFHFIQETDKLLQDSYPTKCKKEGEYSLL